MSLNTARLRGWIVGLAILLLAALFLFFAYARYKRDKFIADLPGRLGVNIGSTSDSYTLSRTGKNGKTAFTIHASKAIQYKAGAGATLHDVVITLYGAQGDRSDRIYGSEFDYDQKTGIVTARGEVQIDLQETGPGVAGAASAGTAANAPARATPETIHVKTSGLVFDQKSQVASTTEYVEFSTPKGGGHSNGATYDVDKGLLILDSNVELRSSREGKPVLVHAAHTEFLRTSFQAFLLNPDSTYQSEHGSCNQAIVYFRKDGSAEHIDAQGHVHLHSDGGAEMTAGAAKILLDQRSQPTRADASGGVNFVSNRDPQQMHGNAVEGAVEFGENGVIRHAQARNAVSFVDQQRGLADDPQGSATRELRAAQVDIDFIAGGDGKAVPSKALATGGATAVLHTVRTKDSQNTTVKGDQLLATLQNGKTITSLHGSGHTSVLDTSPIGATNLSSGDTLQVNFAPATNSIPQGTGQAPAAGAKNKSDVGGETSRIQSVTQEGNVVIIQTPAPVSAGTKREGGPTRATAGRADYNAADEILRLHGSPRINDGVTDLSADSIEYNRNTMVAHADGDVKATYLQPPVGQKVPGAAITAGPTPSSAVGLTPGLGGQGPTHIIASSADLDQTRGQAIFRGQARLWQGPNSVAAPLIELSRTPEALKAYSSPDLPGDVITTIASLSGPQRQPSIFRVHSRQLLYTDANRKAVFTGPVVAEGSAGTVHCDQTEVLFTAANPVIPPAGSSTSASRQIDHILATGHVVLQQPGRHGTGEKLLYTDQDGKFVLTGTSATPPRLYDQLHGTVSGEALIFNSQDDSVSVSGGPSRAVTDTRTAK